MLSPFCYLARMSEKTAFCTLYVLSFDEDAEVEGETSFERSMSFLPVDLAFFVMVRMGIGDPAPCAQQEQQGGEAVQPCQQPGRRATGPSRMALEWQAACDGMLALRGAALQGPRQFGPAIGGLGAWVQLQFGGLGPMHVATCSLGFLCISLKVSHGGDVSLWPRCSMAGVTAADHI